MGCKFCQRSTACMCGSLKACAKEGGYRNVLSGLKNGIQLPAARTCNVIRNEDLRIGGGTENSSNNPAWIHTSTKSNVSDRYRKFKMPHSPLPSHSQKSNLPSSSYPRPSLHYFLRPHRYLSAAPTRFDA